MTDNKTVQTVLDERKRRIFSLRTLIFVILSVVILYFVLKETKFADVVELFRTADIRFLIFALLTYSCSNFLKALRFRILLHEKVISLKKLFRITSYHNFYNMILPARTGELTLIYYLNTVAGVEGGRGLHSLIVARIMDLFVVGIMFLGSFTLFSWSTMPPELAVTALVMIVLSLLALFFLNRVVGFFTLIFDVIYNRLALEKIGIINKIHGKLNTINKEFADREIGAHFFPLVLVTFAIWFVLYSTFFLIMQGFSVDISYVRSIAGSTGMVLTNVLPINGVGSAGTYEAGWTAGLVLVGVDAAVARATSISSHLVQFFISLIVATIAFFSSKIPGIKP